MQCMQCMFLILTLSCKCNIKLKSQRDMTYYRLVGKPRGGQVWYYRNLLWQSVPENNQEVPWELSFGDRSNNQEGLWELPVGERSNNQELPWELSVGDRSNNQELLPWELSVGDKSNNQEALESCQLEIGLTIKNYLENCHLEIGLPIKKCFENCQFEIHC